MARELLKVTDLSTHYAGFGGSRLVKAVDGVSFSLEEGQTIGVVGESGCGKTTLCLSLVRLLAPGAEIVGGSIELGGRDILQLSEKEMVEVRGKEIAMILQDPMTSLNPVINIESQVGEAARRHRGLKGVRLRDRVHDLLESVRIPSPEVRMEEFPHQMSGGMRQRIAGAIALSGTPGIIIADEPTTSLDVTIQAQYLDLLRRLQKETGVGLIFVTHDLGIVAKMCDEVIVMYAGKTVERGDVRGIFSAPNHPYTSALIRSVPKLGSKDPLYRIEGQPPDLSDLPKGCSFASRCPIADEHCVSHEPPLMEIQSGRMAACWKAEENTMPEVAS
ncbi:MAG: dipeptide/oligopeptide/nickel ABC transporter ATP-binding protein [Acidimicrobiaceae bacterium]|nr:dipeptide/oligopeptide/nickel ABC transporter ATP-binding protein [Acidimicrobiaceae bacterium]